MGKRTSKAQLKESLEKVQYDLIAMLQNETSNIRGNHNPCCNYIELKALADTIDTVNRLLKESDV